MRLVRLAYLLPRYDHAPGAAHPWCGSGGLAPRAGLRHLRNFNYLGRSGTSHRPIDSHRVFSALSHRAFPKCNLIPLLGIEPHCARLRRFCSSNGAEQGQCREVCSCPSRSVFPCLPASPSPRGIREQSFPAYTIMRYRGHASVSPKSGRRFIKPWPASLKLTANLRSQRGTVSSRNAHVR